MRGRSLWGAGWFWPLIPGVFVLGLAAFGKAGPAHWALALLSLALGFHSQRSKRIFVDIGPYIAVALGYDLLRYVRPWFVTEQRVLGCGLRKLELALFPVGGDATWGEYLVAHATPAFDLVAAVPYTIFIYVVFGYGAFLFFRDRARMRRYVLAFAIGNYLAFLVWLAFPAAPPWYLHRHGCGIDLAALPNPGGLERVDALLGITYFSGFYGQSAQVYGALPSLHCAYPLIGLLTAYKATSWRYRVVHIVYVAAMPIAALYLDHHWVLDVLAGWLTAVLAVWLADRWLQPAPVREAVRVSLILTPLTPEGERPRVD